jgi:ribokinase
MVAAVGNDSAGAAARSVLQSNGVDVDRIVARSGVRTGSAVVTVDDAGENSIVVVPGANGTIGSDEVRGMLTDLREGDIVVLQNELPPDVSAAAARAANEARAIVVWNAAPAPTALADMPEAVDVLVVNEHELLCVAELLGLSSENRDGLLSAVARRLDAAVVCTLGGDGSIVLDGNRRESVPAATVQVVDTTAAGDTFIGYLVSDLPADGITAAHLSYAGAAAGLTVTRPGASDSIPHRRDVDRAAAPADRGTDHDTTWSTS